MTKYLFMLMFAAALFVCSTAIGSAKEHTWEARACTEKRAGLATFEAKAPGLHAEVAKLEAQYAAALAVVSKSVTGATEGATTGMGGDVGVGLDVGRFEFMDAARVNADNLQKQLDSAKERERHVGSQIFLLRDIIAGLGCNTSTPAPPVDYGAIDQHTQQYQQSQPGSQTTTSGQSVLPQGPYGAPSSGFGPSGSTQPAGQQGQQPGYGPGPDESGSPRVPYDQIKVEGSIGGETGGKSATPGETPKPAMEKHKKKAM